MRTDPYPLRPQRRFDAVDDAIRWVANVNPDRVRASDPTHVGLGTQASRHARGELLAVRSQILATFQHLTPDEKQALSLWASGLSVTKTAKHLRRQVNAVRLLINGAKEKIGERLVAAGLLERDFA